MLLTGSSITINFHSRRGKKTYLKAQKCFQNFTDVLVVLYGHFTPRSGLGGLGAYGLGGFGA